MAGHRRSRLPRRELVRDSDGTLRDVAEKRRIGIDELRDDIRAGRYFRARTQSTDADCTHEVLGEVLLAGALPGSNAGAGLANLVSLLGAFGNVARDVINDDIGRETSGRNTDRRTERHKQRRAGFLRGQE
jgi:hypothetical protein